MRGLAKIVLVLGVAALVAGPALAQQRQGRGGFGRGAMGGGGAMLLASPDVQKDLKLTDDQKEKVQEATRKVMDKYRDDFAKLRDLSDEERREKGQELGKKFSADTDKALAGILDAGQVKRFKELQLQARGIQAFNDPELQKKLNLNDEQKEKIKTIAEDSQKEMREIFQNAQGDFQGAQKKMQALRKESMDKVASVLNDEQKKSWKDMTGKTFEGNFFGGGRGGRRRNDQ